MCLNAVTFVFIAVVTSVGLCVFQLLCGWVVGLFVWLAILRCVDVMF